jgi:hypothetical protein
MECVIVMQGTGKTVICISLILKTKFERVLFLTFCYILPPTRQLLATNVISHWFQARWPGAMPSIPRPAQGVLSLRELCANQVVMRYSRFSFLPKDLDVRLSTE